MNTNKFDTSAMKQALINFIVPLICLGVSVLLFILVIYPSIYELPTLQEDLQTKISLEKLLADKLTRLNRLLDFKSLVSENTVLVSDVLSPAPLVPQLLTQIDQIAKESGLEVVTLGYSFSDVADKAATGTKRVNVSLGVKGDLNQIQVFLNSLETSARLVDVDSFRYNLETSSDSDLSANFVLSAPYLEVVSTAVTDVPLTLDMSSKEFTDLIAKLKTLKFYKSAIETTSTLPAEIP